MCGKETCPAPSRAGGKDPKSETHLREVVDRILVEIDQIVDNEIVAVRMDDPEARNVGPVLDRFALGHHCSDRHKDLTGQLGIPHEPPRQYAVMDELPALAGRERTHDEYLAFEVLLRDRSRGADRTLAAEREKTLEIRIGAHEIERGAARLVDVLRHPVAIADKLHIGRIGF